MDNKIAKLDKQFVKNSLLFREMENALTHRNLASFRLSSLLGADAAPVEGVKVVGKKRNETEEDPYFFNSNKDPNVEYACSLFYRIYYGDNANHLNSFKVLKAYLRDFNITFLHKKKIDESYIIVLQRFYEELIAENYSYNQFQKALDIFKRLFEKEFAAKVDFDESWTKFMKTMEELFKAQQEILRMPMKDTFEFRLEMQLPNLSKTNPKVASSLGMFAEQEALEDISGDEVAERKKEVARADIQGEAELLKFREEEANLNYDGINQTQENLTAIQKFHRRFHKELSNGPIDYYEALLICFDYLMNPAKTNDEIIDPILQNLGENFEAAIYLTENRDALIDEIKDAQKKVEQESKTKSKERSYAKVSSNFIITKKQKNKGQSAKFQMDQALDVFRILGISGDDTDSETLQNLQNKIKTVYAEKNADDAYYESENMDFIEEDEHVLHQKFGMTRKERGLKIVFDVQPTAKSLSYKKTERLKIKDIFPETIIPVFNDSDTLNNLQSVIYDSVFNSDENILCCAPTGAGKTNVALMSIARLIHRHLDPKTKKLRSDFKVVYLSPLKALASEIVSKFSSKLEFLGIKVRESTGDISLSKAELASTNIIVSTPEKWDVMTRKSEELNSIISLLIIDEIHLLDDVRGRVLECLVARTVRLIEAKQCRIRLLGLSATLPNYTDVAKFLRVNKNGLFFFDESFRPVPLYKKFIGIKKLDLYAKKTKETGEIIKPGATRIDLMNETCYDILKENLKQNKQVLVFVHSRKETVTLAEYFVNIAASKGELNIFMTESFKGDKMAKRFENRDLQNLAPKGIGVHNAGIKRKDRTNVERSFIEGHLSVVVCTATLAWGINMPCHTVIIKGTDFYEPGFGFRPISLLDVQQIFGRAGRPQYDKYGEAVLITKAEDLNYFISMLSYVKPIESHFKNFMLEAILAEAVLGNISNIQEAINFVKSTFFYIRYLKNPVRYGVKDIMNADLSLNSLVESALRELHRLRLVRYDEKANVVESTEFGRISSFYYVNCETMEKLCYYLYIYEDADGKKVLEDIDEKNLLGIIAQANEFDQISAKPEEEAQLLALRREFKWVEIDDDYKDLYKEKMKGLTKDAKEERNKSSFDQLEKIILLFWGYLYGHKYDVYSLESDTNYVTENGLRIMRCLFEISLKENNAVLAEKILIWIRFIENCLNENCTPLRMFCFENYSRSVYARKNQISEVSKLNWVAPQACGRLENALHRDRNSEDLYSVSSLRENVEPLKDLHVSHGNESMLIKAVKAFPFIDVVYEAKPIAQEVIKITLKLKPCFIYNRIWHMKKELFWILVCNGNELIHHAQIAIDSNIADLSPLDEKALQSGRYVESAFFVPLKENADSYLIKIMSDHFVDADTYCELSLAHMKVNMEKMDYSTVLDLRPLKIEALQNEQFIATINPKLKFFNPIQTQIFWPLYHTDENVIVGAPTGSGKTLIAELAIFRVFAHKPHQKVVYIAPYKALVKERLKDWKSRFPKILGKKVHELSGDHTPDFKTLTDSDLIITTPEKWDGITRKWQSRAYVKSVALVIFDEIHLLGQERGAVIEVIVSRMNYISAQTGDKVRMIGLSTAMANGSDVGNWFGVKKEFMFNFKPNARPVPLEIYFKGFSEKNYCPRMNSMNKPAYNDIKKFSNGAPTLIFVSSRRQTRLTALDIISLSASEFSARSPYLRMNEDETQLVLNQVKDNMLKQTLTFGVGVHHAGLDSNDREIVEDLFVNAKILVLVATSTLAWGVNFPAKLVIIKGTEFYDAKTRSWVDMPISDILQMIGRAGRPQFNDKGYACVYVEKSKKNFYRKYLNEAFPIESSFDKQLHEHLNAEIASGSIKNKQSCIDFISWTYFFRRLIRNPAFYGLESTEAPVLQKYLINLVDRVTKELAAMQCIEIDDEDFGLVSTSIGNTAALYYISPKSAFFLCKSLQKDMEIVDLLKLLCDVEEYAEVPVRHNEAELNISLSQICPYKINKAEADSPHVKTFLLFQAYFSSLPLPIRDYITDTKLVIDSAFRIIAAMIDFAAESGNINNCFHLLYLMQMIVQGTWHTASQLQNIPHFDEQVIKDLKSQNIQTLAQLHKAYKDKNLQKILSKITSKKLTDKQIEDITECMSNLPDIALKAEMFKFDSEEMEVLKKRPHRFRGGEEAMVEVSVFRNNHQKKLNVDLKRLARDKSYSWWIIVGNRKQNKLMALKKLMVDKQATKGLQIDLPMFGDGPDAIVEVHLISDSFIGLDQMITIDLRTYESPVSK